MEGFLLYLSIIMTGEFAFPLTGIDPNNKKWSLFISLPPKKSFYLAGP